MMNILCLQFNPLQENCYIVSDDTHEAVVIDPGAFFDAERQALAQQVREHGLVLRHVVCTHGHFDHIFGCDTLFDEFGILPEIHAADVDLYNQVAQQTAEIMGLSFTRTLPAVGRVLGEGDTIRFGHHCLSVIHTPGHSPGGVVLHCEQEHAAFSGDTLFRMSVGRTDFHGGSFVRLQQSLARLSDLLPSDTTVYPGHGPHTTMADEVHFNPYFH